MGPDPFAQDLVVGAGDESEAIGGLFDEDVGVRVERKLEDLGEDVRESPEFLLAEGERGGFREGRSGVISQRDVPFLGYRMNLHGFGQGKSRSLA